MAIVTGYYRYTDIWFHVEAEILDSSQSDPLKAVLAHDSIVHPDNPLHVEGVEGASMSLGTFHDGKQRLLFTSAQVDYVRYWLHAMKLTKELIPLPYSECLLLPEEFSNVAPVVYRTGGDLRNALKKIDKTNKRLKNSTHKLLARRDAFEHVRKYWDSKSGTWFALDFEDWEYDHTVVTEFGWSSLHWENGEEVTDCGHLTVKEYNLYRNGKTLKRFEIPLNDAVFYLPQDVPKGGTFIIDTAILYAALIGEEHKTTGLEQTCHQLQIETDFMHNAGNDAYSVLRALASGDPLDTQREMRWPKRTGISGVGTNSGVKVQHPLAADGAKGIQAYIGTLYDGQGRLFFSSAQVDYLRYWMHAMKLTDQLIPMPYSDCLFLESSVASAIPVVFQSVGALSYHSKKLGRMNRTLNEKPLLVPRRAMFERVRDLWNAKQGVWCAFSVAAWESDHTVILDLAWSLVRWESGEEITEHEHLIVGMNQKYQTTALEEGVERIGVTKAMLKTKVNNLFARFSQSAPIFLISNDSKGDLKYLRGNDLQISLADVDLELPSTMPSNGTFIVEPAELFDALTGSGAIDVDHNLERICKHLKVDLGNVRNAGTEAKGLARTLRSMASGPRLDVQREQRWPEQTELEVEFQAWVDNGQHGDLEGCFPPQRSL
ncbi:hypothetical protein R3P38DRAFT_3302936 [Favolaschia claudopus]|uniref:Gfd2/YDR514C-like C-terminal domain-containing protein n=1 Tax=Favolaschia claudopus TaxID=2862362 RepID=A0AAW0EC96_9AGAR